MLLGLCNRGGVLFRRMVMKAAAAAERHHGMMCRWRFKIEGSDVA